MHLYRGSTEQFIGDAVRARLAGLLADRFFDEYRYRPAQSEVNAWQNSLRAMADILQLADLRDQGILVELRLPLTSKRLDCLITGSNPERGNSAVVVELKQWTAVGSSTIPESVTVAFGDRIKDHLHPSAQVRQYERYLQDTHPAFSDGGVWLAACSYLHNATYDPKSPIWSAPFAALTDSYPAFSGDQADKLATYLDQRVTGPDDGSILDQIAVEAFRPHKRLMDHVARVIKHEPAFVLLDEQQVVFNAIMQEVGAAGQNAQRVVYLIRGGPGTGKSVIAVNLVAELSSLGLRSVHATGSKAFTENLRQTVGPRASALFSYFMSLANVPETFDVVILDEAHRIRTVSGNRFTPAAKRTGKSQMEDLLDAGRITVFFIDDLQVVRPEEVGSSHLIKQVAAERGVRVREFELEAQFRANGSDAFIEWIDNTLETARTPQVLWPLDDPFEFRVVPSVQELERLVRLRSSEGHTARMAAGFCWPWSDPLPSGELVADVQIGDWRMPWNAKPEAGLLAASVPKSYYWASDARGLGQVGCIYTAQGFEFDYVGVIVGPDLVYRPGVGWIGQPEQSKDNVVRRTNREAFTDFVKHTYRVLMTRGLLGCYVYFMDAQTRDFFLSRTERSERQLARAAERPDGYGGGGPQ
jgi:DUF2075 family protein